MSKSSRTTLFLCAWVLAWALFFYFASDMMRCAGFFER